MVRKWVVSLAGLALLLAAADAGAQANSSIAGTVRDATGAVLPGVTVEASSPALIEKVRSAVSDATGQYKIVQLVPGTYTVTFALPGFSTAKREDISLTTEFTATVNAELRLGDVAETITVVGESPLVDTQNVVQQQVLSRAVMDAIPTARGYANLAVLVPGIQLSGQGRGEDVGGSAGVKNQGLAIHGGRSDEVMVHVDGLPIGALEATDGAIPWMTFPDGNAEEISVEVGAHSAEIESHGVRVSVVPKSGGNQFKGSFFGSYTNQHLGADNLTDSLKARGLPSTNGIRSLTDLNPSGGGPIVRDRVWFYLGYRDWRTYRYSAAYPDTNPTDWVYTPNPTRGPQDQVIDDVSGRVTWQASAKNKFNFNFNHDDRCDCEAFAGDLEVNTTPAAGVVVHYPSKIVQTTWVAPITSRLLLEAGAESVRTGLLQTPMPQAIAPPALELSTGLAFRARAAACCGYTENYTLLHGRNYLYRGAASYVTGSNTLKVGATFNPGSTGFDKTALGDYLVVLLNGAPSRVEYFATPYHTDEQMRKLAFFAQNQWTHKRLTLIGGLRYDWLKTDYPALDLPATSLLPARHFDGADVLNWKDVNPRLGLAYDVFGNGKTAVKVNVDRYVRLGGLLLTENISPAIAAGGRLVRSWSDANHDFVPNGDPLNPLPNGELGPTTNANFGKPVFTLRYDPTWTNGWDKRDYTWETAASVQHELMSRVSLNAGYTRRWYGNFAVTDNLAVAPTDYDPYCVTTPSDARLPGGGGQQICGLYDIKPSKLSAVDNLRTLASNYGTQYEYWHGADFSVAARLRPGTIVQGGFSTGRAVSDNCDVVAKLDNPSLLYCHKTQPFVTQVKLLASYQLPWQLQIAGTFQSVPGIQTGKQAPQFGVAGNYVATNAQIAPSLGRNLAAGVNGTATINLIEPGTILGDTLNQIDLRLTRAFSIGAAKMKGMFDLYNLLNANPVLAWNDTYGTNGATWQRPQTILQGRLAKFSVQLSF